MKDRNLLFYYLFFAAVISCNPPTIHTPKISNETAIPKDTTWRILRYGALIKYDQGNAMSVVAKKYGFEYLQVAACEATQELIDSVKMNNQLIEAKLAQKYGENWQTMYNADVDKEDSIEQIVLNVIAEAPVVKVCKLKLNKDEELHFGLTPINNKSKYEVKATYIKDTVTLVAYQCLMLLVDYQTKKVEVISDKHIKIYPTD